MVTNNIQFPQHSHCRSFSRHIINRVANRLRILLLPILILPCLLVASPSFAQDAPSPDLIYEQARTAAFEQKDYPKAIALCKQALTLSPDYGDIEVFLGKLYTWTDQPDSAKQVFDAALKKHPLHEEAYLAYGNLEFWNKHPEKALELSNSGLHLNPRNKDLLLLKAQVLNELKRYKEAGHVLNALLAEDPKNTGARTLAGRLGDQSVKHHVSVNHTYSHFGQQAQAPWHLSSMEYSRQTKLGPITGRVNYANRFSRSGVQLEAEAYPRISKTFYAFTQAAWSGDERTFPGYRAGFSLYANLPAAFEADAGFRYLHFTSSTWIYTAALGKYYKNYWFNARTYLTPGAGKTAQAYSATLRYYYGGADDYITLAAGTGISPDDSNNILLDNPDRLRSNNISAGYRRAFRDVHVLNVNLSLLNQEYTLNTRGTQVDVGMGYQLRF